VLVLLTPVQDAQLLPSVNLRDIYSVNQFGAFSHEAYVPPYVNDIYYNQS
jgi:hypothetical protein